MQLCRWRALCTHASRHGHKPTILPHCSSQPTCNYATDLHHEGSESETDEGTQGFPGIVQFVKAGTTFRFRRRRRHRIVTRPSGAVEALAITMPAEPSHYVPSGVTGTKALQSTSRTPDDIAVQRIVPLQQVFPWIHKDREQICLRCARFVFMVIGMQVGMSVWAAESRDISIGTSQVVFERNDSLHEGDGSYRSAESSCMLHFERFAQQLRHAVQETSIVQRTHAS